MWINAVEYDKIKKLQEKGYIFTGKHRTNKKTGILQYQMKFSKKELIAIKQVEASPYMNRKE